MTLSWTTFSIKTFSIPLKIQHSASGVVMPSVVVTNVIARSVIILKLAFCNCYADYNYVDCHYAECLYVECRNAECHNKWPIMQCCCAECRGTHMWPQFNLSIYFLCLVIVTAEIILHFKFLPSTWMASLINIHIYLSLDIWQHCFYLTIFRHLCCKLPLSLTSYSACDQHEVSWIKHIYSSEPYPFTTY